MKKSCFKSCFCSKAGFTLIELLVVVLIIGILAAVALPQYQYAVNKSRAVQALTLLTAIVKAQEVYWLNNGTYTTDLTALDIDVPTELRGTGLSSKPFVYRVKCGTYNCYSQAGSEDLPTFEVRMLHQPSSYSKHAGKMWCQVGNPVGSEKARRICNSMGSVDSELNKNYYLMNK